MHVGVGLGVGLRVGLDSGAVHTMYVPFVQALSDPEQREIYDRSGEDGLQKHRGGNGGSDMFSRYVSALSMALSCHDNSNCTQHRVRTNRLIIRVRG